MLLTLAEAVAVSLVGEEDVIVKEGLWLRGGLAGVCWRR